MQVAGRWPDPAAEIVSIGERIRALCGTPELLHGTLSL
jgi:hypothetical protein